MAFIAVACTPNGDVASTTASQTVTTIQQPRPTVTSGPTFSTTTPEPLTLAVYDAAEGRAGMTPDSGGDVDYEMVTAGSTQQHAIRSGNGSALPSADGNATADYYLQFRITDDLIFEGQPTSRVRIEIEYLDEGTDTFNIQYDGLDGGPNGDGTFKDTGVVQKSDTGTFQTATFPLCDAFFANRNNGADFRIADWDDGPETIRRVSVTISPEQPIPTKIPVEYCGANPFDSLPDGRAIQECIDHACPGDTVLFTSAQGDPAYRGYLIDRTVFLVRPSSKRDLTFTSTNPDDHALLAATADLRGFVVRLYPRAGISDPGFIDEITVADLDFDGNRQQRLCNGLDGAADGIDDNWGSWLPECELPNDPWCNPGGLAMNGGYDPFDSLQEYERNPDQWSTGLTVRDVRISNVECGTALSLFAADSEIQGVTIDTAGDHVHGEGCTATDPDEPPNAWSDGITTAGPAIRILDNEIRDASDIGIVTFGGKDFLISGNTVFATPGNHGMFAGIAVHPYIFGLIPDIRVVGNTVVNQGDEVCGGIHTGIDIGTHMWGAGCNSRAAPSSVGFGGSCSSLSMPPGFHLCPFEEPCRVWGYVPPDTSFTLADNMVNGAQINYLVEGLDVQGNLIVSGNASRAPRMTDWQDDAACTWDGITDSWGPLEYVAHDPSIANWLDQRIYCER